MTSLRITHLLLIFLHMITGASGGGWSVKYNQTEICAPQGSTVSFNGTYTYPAGLEVKEEFWVIDLAKPAICNCTKDSGRVQCSVDKQQHFSLTLSNITKEDEHEYHFRIKTNVEKEKWLGGAVKINVTELHVKTPREVTEGETADLACTTTCSLTDSPTFIWYKNGRPLSSNTNPLHLQSVSSEDAGSYRCAVRGYEHLPSLHQTLTVTYPPKNVSVSNSPSGEIMEDSSVTLTCSSDANPPVQNYTWFKEGETSPVGSGQSYSITNIIAEHTGLYYCVAQNEHGALNGTVTITVKSLFYILPIAVGTGLCGVVLSVMIVLLLKRESLRRCRNQKRNTDEPDHEYVGFDPHPKDHTSTSSCPVYENVETMRKHHYENRH
ncbi:B-cell receptor CD22 isoform X3 [Brachyhypopomus gauderio]|uniref:B-cell receptor CD22 isoform X3 n=1 Tax=Brachyhypopomus gauderio TaxID=698409 RepID=UPI00404245C0